MAAMRCLVLLALAATAHSLHFVEVEEDEPDNMAMMQAGAGPPAVHRNLRRTGASAGAPADDAECDDPAACEEEDEAALMQSSLTRTTAVTRLGELEETDVTSMLQQ
mmetsp:Transcript_19876/g.52185  ORF Transcript_19876/g.52185 Transcript_19876/m.52185 type:complete len:107 (-) Transcript_19876:113-433(-)